MSLRRLCKETGKRPSKALFYFPEENKTGIAPTRVVDNDTVLTEGKLVTVNWAGERVPAEILALNDDEEVLKLRDLEWLKQNMPPASDDKDHFEPPRKKVAPQKKRKDKGENKENENKQNGKKNKKNCRVLKLVENKSGPLEQIPTEVLNRLPGPDAVARTPSQTHEVPSRQEALLSQPGAERVPPTPSPTPSLFRPSTLLTIGIPLPQDEEQAEQTPDLDLLEPPPEPVMPATPQFSPLPEIHHSFLSDLFDDDFSESDTRDKLNRLYQNQQVIISLLSKLLGVQSSGRDKGADSFASNRLLQSRESQQEVSHCESSQSFISEGDPILSVGMDDGEDSSFFREIVKLKGGSCSMGNFAVKLVQMFYSPSELIYRNCGGSRGKEALEPTKLAKVKEFTFKLYPTPSTLKEEQWKKCVIAIDEYLRRKKKDVNPRQD